MNKLTSILHLEDDDNDAELVQAMLELGDISCQITRVQTGGEFDQALCKENFDLILADYRLPGYDGISALRRAQERCPDVPFIFVSGIMGEDAAIDGLTQGATDYVLKNKLVRLSSAVKRALAEADNKKERKQAEETVRESEARFRVVANSANDGIVSTDSQGIVFYWNQTAQTIFGYTEDEIVGQSLTMLMPERHQESYQAALNRWFGSQENRPLSRTVEAVGRRKDGVEFPIELSVGGWETREGTFFTAIIRDITERKRAEDERQAHLRFFQSMDQINRAIQSTNELNQMMSAVLSAVISIFDCDRSFLMYPCDPKADAWFSPMECTRPEYPGILAAGQKLPMDSEVALTLQLLLDSDGPVKFGPGNDHPLPADVSERFGIKSFMSLALYPWVDVPWQFGIHQCSYARIWTPDDERLFQEIGRRLTDALTSLLSYRNLLESEERYRRLVELSPDVIAILSQERIVFVNPAMLRLHAAKSEADLIEKSIFDFIDPDDHEIAKKCIGESARGENLGLFVEIKFLRFDGSTVDVEVAGVPYEAGGLQYTQIIARDITQRKQHELEREAIITVSNALRRATNRSEILTIILDQVLELFDADGAMLAVPNSITQGIIIEMGRGTVGNRFSGLNIPPGLGVSAWVIENKQPYLSNKADSDALFYRADLLAGSHCVAAVPLIANEQAIGALWIARRTELMERDLRLLNAIGDIAANALHRVTLHEQTEMHLRHLMALHQIDIAITTNFDLSVTLNIILGNVKNELVMDAASILLLTPFTQTLEYAAGAGFRTRVVEQSRVKLGTGHAGRAALEYRTVICPNLAQAPASFGRSALVANEEFLSHFVTPLIVKGQVKGVLEVFHRQPFEPGQDWLDYFETLATQAAIAIDNAFLFENLQRSNTELRLAYDATIEGWSRALDMRDKETEGHTLRVTEMALRLAEKMGMSDSEKVNLRRGALLHDIGKMGVPDTILLKPGPLTDDEWKIMRQHPTFAYEMLKPIDYLRPALDIPYCHHEKWDGSGYPRGLKGDAIPLAARVFAVIDVFDALTVDRPYRQAWQKEKVYTYIREHAGKHFDPEVVAAFLLSEW